MLGETEISSWDESRHGVSAMEMIESGNYLVNTHMGSPDYWNAKPPLAFAPMVAGFKVFGFTSLGLRFFSALAVLISFIAVTFYCLQAHGTRMAIYVAALLATSRLLINDHGARTGDADALYILLYTLCFLLIISSRKSCAKFYLASFIAGLAFLTKSFHAGTLCFTIFVVFLMDNPISISTFKRGLACIACALLPVGLWMLLRYQYDGTAFFEKMLFGDLIIRSTQVLEGHTGPPYYYLNRIYFNFQPWFLGLFVLAGGLFVFRKHLNADVPPISRKFFYKLLVIIFIPLTANSIAASKLSWYLYGIYPAISLMLAVILIYIRHKINFSKGPVIAFNVILLVCFIGSEALVVAEINKKAKPRGMVQYTMKTLAKEKPGVDYILFVLPPRRDNIFARFQLPWKPADSLAARMYGNFTLNYGSKELYDLHEGKNKILLDQAQIVERVD